MLIKIETAQTMNLSGDEEKLGNEQRKHNELQLWMRTKLNENKTESVRRQRQRERERTKTNPKFPGEWEPFKMK